MAIAYRSSSTNASGAAVSSLNVTKPAGVVDGDCMVAFVVIAADQTVTVVPAGWTLLNSQTTGTATGDCRHYVYRRIAASEGASYTWTFSGGVDCAIAILAYSGVHATTPIHTSASNLMSGSTLSQTAPAVTTTSDQTVAIYAYGTNPGVVGNLTFSTPTGLTARAEADPAGSTTNRAVLAVYEAAVPTATTTATKTSTIDNSAKGVAWTVVLAPSGAIPAQVSVQPLTATANTQGCMLGWYETQGYSALQVDEAELDTHFAVVRVYHSPKDFPTIKSSTMNSIANDGRLVMASHKPPHRGGAWAEIYKGNHNASITAWIDYYKGLAPKEVIFIFHHEPHDNCTDLKPEKGIEGTASDYVKAYRHIGKMFRDANANNVLLGYCAVANTWANKKASGSTVVGSGDKCYPGDDLVDVLCHDEYNTAGEDFNPNPSGGVYSYGGSSWRSFEDEYAETVALAKRLNKPLIFGEIGSNHSKPEGDRNEWFRDGAAWIKNSQDAKDFLKGFCYYHVDNHDDSGHWWRFVGTDTMFDGDGKQGFKDGFSSDSYFKTAPFSLLTENPVTSSLQPTGISTQFTTGLLSIAPTAGVITLRDIGGIASPSDYDLVEEVRGQEFGTASVTTLNIILPTAIPSAEVFGALVLSRRSAAGYIFTPPIRHYAGGILPDTRGIQRALFKYYRGAPVGHNVYLMANGTITEAPYDWNAITTVYHGGHEITITDAEEAVLRSAGYDSNIIAVPPGPNLLTADQASMEAGITGWIPSFQCTLSQSSIQALDGVYSLAMTSTNPNGTMTAITTNVAISPNTQYTALLSLWAPASGKLAHLSLRWFAADGTTLIGTSNSTADSTAGWTSHVVTATSPATAQYAAVAASFQNTSTGQIYYADKALLRAGSNTSWFLT